ncbi:hypothetical protein LOD99_156 [Oopsacas minuta]|uniref:Uncharacterized protein n=1 Tax=Oopsacas minuta TaxID=111878 RepID=A0AAV7K8E2_9METZ|nr:hypothetical protein LOD99_156 [Oopsacas minuta]
MEYKVLLANHSAVPKNMCRVYAGSAKSNAVLSNSIGDATVINSRISSSCVELSWTHLIFNLSSIASETFIISIDNTTIATEHNGTLILVCNLITDGIPFYLEVTSSRVGKIFSGSITIPLSISFPYYILLAVLLPALVAFLLLLCCIAIVICCWKSNRYAIFKVQKDSNKGRNYWSKEEEFVEVSPVDIQPMEERLFVPQQNRDRSGTFDSSADSWMDRGRLQDVEQGVTRNHNRDNSFDSTSFILSEAPDDSMYCNTINTTMASDDRSISPRKYSSLRGRPRFLPPGSDLRKAKKSHSWHNLRHKRFRRSASKLNDTDKRSSELYKNNNKDESTQNIGESITTVTDSSIEMYDNPSTDIQPVESPPIALIAVSTELYQGNEPDNVIEPEYRSTSISNSSTDISRDSTEDIILDPSEPVSKPIVSHTPASGPIQDNTLPTFSEIYDNRVATYDLDEPITPIDISIEEATIATFLPKNNKHVTRPSLDLSAGHVMGMTIAYEIGDLPLEENKPRPIRHDRSFTSLPLEENVPSRRSIFQIPGEEPLNLSYDMEPDQSIILMGPPEPSNQVTSQPTEDTIDTQNTE